MGEDFFSGQYHLLKGRAALPPCPAASLVPNVCPGADDRPGAPSNSGQEVTRDKSGSIAPVTFSSIQKKKKVVAVTITCACMHPWACACICTLDLPPSLQM